MNDDTTLIEVHHSNHDATSVYTIEDIAFLINPIRAAKGSPVSKIEIFLNPSIEKYETDKFNPRDPNGSIQLLISEKFSKQPDLISMKVNVQKNGVQIAEVVGATGSEGRGMLVENEAIQFSVNSKLNSVKWVNSSKETTGKNGATDQSFYFEFATVEV